MSRVVALSSSTGKLAQFLIKRGYKVIDTHEAQRPRTDVDAFLHTGYLPDRVSHLHSVTEAADITVGSPHTYWDGCPHPIALNITGQSPEQVALALEHHLQQPYSR